MAAQAHPVHSPPSPRGFPPVRLLEKIYGKVVTPEKWDTTVLMLLAWGLGFVVGARVMWGVLVP